MGSLKTTAYCGFSQIISSLGDSLAANISAIEGYVTHSRNFTDGTPVCLIERSVLNGEGLDGFTFAEQLSIRALSNVILRSGVTLDHPRTILVFSTTKGNVEYVRADFQRSYLWDMANRVAEYVGCCHKPVIVSNACISGVAAVVMGARWIEQGVYDHVYVLGVDVVSEFVVSGFNSFKSISSTVCKPYDVARDGLTLGEGCGALLLTKDSALSDSKIVVSGGGVSSDANHISGPSRTGDGLFYALEAALKQANIRAEEISFVNAHGTGTVFNDEMESKALKRALLEGVPCNSLKPYLGHTLGASGVIEIILTVEQLRRNCVFGVKGYLQNGVPFELNVSAKHREMELSHAIKCASGFGGTNAAVVLSKEEAISERKIGVQREIGVEEVAQMEVVFHPNMPFSEQIRFEYKTLGESNLKFYKMDNLSKLGYVTACKLMSGVELPYLTHRIGVVLANRSSSLDTDLNHQKIVEQHLPEGASPAVFVYTLANIVAAEIAIKQKFQGELWMFVEEKKEIIFLRNYSYNLIETGICDAVLYGWCELFKDEYNAELKLIRRG